MPPKPLRATAFPWRCPSCQRHRPLPSATRSLTTTRALTTDQPPPTSPRYIPIPQSPQRDIRRRQPVKGILPIPRDIFSRARGPTAARLDPAALALSTPRRTRPLKATNPEQAAHNAWRTRMAAVRRKNLVEGLKALAARRAARDQRAAQRSDRNRADREALVAAPMPEDERLAATSVTAALKPVRGLLTDPNRERRLADRRAHVEAARQSRAETTQKALHTLYMRAREFIVTEEQLDSEIEREFGTQEQPRTWGNRKVSVWGLNAPPTIRAMLDRARSASGGTRVGAQAGENADAQARLTRDRLGKLAEELTGGKM